MSLSADPTLSLLEDEFVCGWRDITGEPWSGVSGRYDTDDGAVWTTNGAGPHNIQLFVLAPDGTVLHCLPGYWETHDLAAELGFAKDLWRVWRDGSLTREQKDAKFAALHLGHVAQHSRECVARSDMQGFDKKFELKRAATSDCVVSPNNPRLAARGKYEFKTTDQIAHERMAARPFVSYEEFDVEAYTDYGRQKYDKKQAKFADVLPKSGPGGLRDKVKDAVLIAREVVDSMKEARKAKSGDVPPKAAPRGLGAKLTDTVRRAREVFDSAQEARKAKSEKRRRVSV